MGGGRPWAAPARDVTCITSGSCQQSAGHPVQVAKPNRRGREPTMRVLVAGATGAMGMELVPRLVDAGHEVFAMVRSDSGKVRAARLGAVPVIADALDRAQVEAAVREAAPEVIVNQLTAIRHIDTRHFERSFAATDRLRIEGTDNLLAAARATGVRRFVAQSIGAFTYARTGGPV